MELRNRSEENAGHFVAWLNNQDLLYVSIKNDRAFVVNTAIGNISREVLIKEPIQRIGIPDPITFPKLEIALVPSEDRFVVYNHKTNHAKLIESIFNCTYGAMAPDGKTLYLSHTSPGGVTALNFPELTEKWTHPMRRDGNCTPVVASSNGLWVMAASPVACQVEVFEAETGKPLGNPMGSGSWVEGLSFIGQGDLVAIGNAQDQLFIRDTQTGQLRFAPINDALSFNLMATDSTWIWISGPKSYALDATTNERLTPSYGATASGQCNPDMSMMLVGMPERHEYTRYLVGPDNRPIEELVAEAQQFSFRQLDSTGGLSPPDKR